ncbi:MAG: polysaccharide biosynthesis protein [candidate division Zixibacteria bacterium]|nr:polysaccharide biosynthesis protein [candidate division Zixibacteria bacterium]
MAKARIIARNLVANWVGHGANLVVMFFLSPFILHTLGMTQYGIWQILTVLTGYMGILDLGVRASTGRYIVLYLGKEEYDKVDETIRTGLGMYSAVGGLIFVAGCILGAVFPWVFPSVPQEYHMTVAVLLPVLAVNIWISAFRTVLSSVLAAHERFDLARGSDLVMLAVRTVGTVVALKLGFHLIGLTAAIVGCNVVGLLVNLYMARRVHQGLRLWPLMLKRERIGELYNYGIGAFAIAVSFKIIGQTDLVIVGNLINIDAVAVYSVGAMLLYYSDTFLGQIITTFFPSLQRAVARDEMGSARWMVFRQVRLAMILGLLMYIGYLTFGESFIRLWMFHPEKFPQESVTHAAQVMAILAGSKLLTLFGFGSRSLLAATGHIGFAAKMTVVEALTNLALSVAFVVLFGWGLAGVAAGTLVARFLTQTFVVPQYACRKAGINWWRYVMVIGGSGLATGGMFAVVCYGVQHILPARNWSEFSLQVAVATACYVPIALLLLVSTEDRRRMGIKLRTLLPGT